MDSEILELKANEKYIAEKLFERFEERKALINELMAERRACSREVRKRDRRKLRKKK